MPDHSSVSEAWLTDECYRICARASAVPLNRRNKFFAEEIRKLQVSPVLRLALENMLLAKENAMTEANSMWEKITAISFGGVFIVVILIMAILYPSPTPFQFFVFRVVLSLAAAGVGGVLSGFLHVAFGSVEKPWLRAGGALAVFAVVYLLNPAKIGSGLVGR